LYSVLQIEHSPTADDVVVTVVAAAIISAVGGTGGGFPDSPKSAASI